MQHTKKPYSRQQLIWIYKQYLLEEAKLVHRIFDKVISEIMTHIISAVMTEKYDPKMLIYTGYVYDSTGHICIKTNSTDKHHPIYVRLTKEDNHVYEAYINTRIVDGRTPQKLEHDKIVVNINVPAVISSTRKNHPELRKRIPSLLAHEFTHAKDMWSFDYINVINDLINIGYNEVNKTFLKERNITNISKDDIDALNGMLYFMSPAETSAIYEGFDKYLKYTSDGQLLYFIGSEPGRDKRMIAADLFSVMKNLAKINNRYASVRLEDFAKDNNYTIPVLFTAYAVYLGFIPDTSGYFKDFSIAKEVIDGNMFVDENMSKMMMSAFLELEIKYGEFVADIEDLIIECLDERGIFEQVYQNELNENYLYPYPNHYINEKLSVYGQLSELESPFQPYLFKFTGFDVPAIHTVLESENRNKEVTMYDILGHY